MSRQGFGAVWATLIVTFGFSSARRWADMAPTLENQTSSSLQAGYELGDHGRATSPLYYPLIRKEDRKRVIAKEGDTSIVDGRVYVNDIPLHDAYVP